MSSITSIFHPFLGILADLIAFFYGRIHDYSFAIAALTIVVYLLLTPLLVKQTRSMIQMQKLQPELKKIQNKYKGRDLESKQKLQEEMMALYKEHGVNPMGGCLSAIPQLLVLGVMYGVIRGLLSVKIKSGHDVLVHGLPVAQPKYISHSSLLYHNLLAAHGKMMSLGINLALAPEAHHSSITSALPYYALLLGAVGLSFLQIQQMTIRNKKIMEITPQMRQMQRMQMVMPAVMIVIYWRLAAALCIYFIASSTFRIVQQELMYRYDPVLVAHVGAAVAKRQAAGKPESNIKKTEPTPGVEKSPDTPSGTSGKTGGKSTSSTAKKVSDESSETLANGSASADQSAPDGKETPLAQRNGSFLPRRPGNRGNESHRKEEVEDQNGNIMRPHPRSKSKRPRKTR